MDKRQRPAPISRLIGSTRRTLSMALAGLVLAGGAAQVAAHNLQTKMVYMFFDPNTQQDLDVRAADPGFTPGTDELLQVGDELGLIIKVIPKDGTNTGVGGHVDFYVPNGVEVIDAAYLLPGDSNPGDGISGYDKVPMKGQSLIAIGDGPIGAKTTAQIAGIAPVGPNVNGVTQVPADSTGLHLGTVSGVYGDTGIFYATDPDTAWGSWQVLTNPNYPAVPTVVDSCGTTVVGLAAGSKTITNNSGDVFAPCNKWDAGQMYAWGVKGTTFTGAGASSSPIVDYGDGRGNAPWGFAAGAAGPQSGYAWAFDWDEWAGSAKTAADMRAAMDNASVGPWKRIQYPGSRVSLDQPGLESTDLGISSIDAGSLGFALSPASPLPETEDQADTTSPKALRWAVGQLTLNVPEYVWVKVRVKDTAEILNNDGCPVFHSDTFGGDAGGDSNGKDHLWRYYEPSVNTWNGCLAIGKPSNRAAVAVGETFQYNVRVFNAGANNLSNVKIVDTLPSGVQFISSVPAQNTGPNPLQWNVGTLLTGESFEATVTVKATSSGALTNTVCATSDQLPQQCAEEIVYSGNIPVLKQNKTASEESVAPGANFQYTITIDNIGSGPSGSPVGVEERLEDGINYVSLDSVTVNGASYTAATTVTAGTEGPHFTVPAAINAGQRLVLTFTVQASPTAEPGTYCNSFTSWQNGLPLTTGSLACVNIGGGAIGDTIFYDWNGDGVQGQGDLGIPGVTLELQSGGCTAGTNCPTTTTDASGNYIFEGLAAGTYTVVVTDTGNKLNGFTQTYDLDGTLDEKTTLTVGATDRILTADFGYLPGGTGSIGDKVFNDANGNGVDDSETGIPNIAVKLYVDNNGNGIIDAGEPLIGTQNTTVGGAYSFTGLALGIDYLVQVDANDPDIAAFFSPNAFAITTSSLIPIADLAGAVATADFGFQAVVPAALGDQVFVDNNGNGVYDAGDDPIGSVNVSLYRDTNGNGLLDAGEPLVGTDTTDPDGIYGFAGLSPGNYIVDVDQTAASIPGGYAPSKDLIATNLTSGETDNSIDFPFVPVLSKAVDKATAAAGEVLTYTLSPGYQGAELLTDVRVSDATPAGTTYNGNDSPTATTEPSVGATGTVTWDLGSNTARRDSTTGAGLCPAELTLVADKDTFLTSNGDAGKNYGGSEKLHIDADKIRHSLVHFGVDQTTLPVGAVLDSADLLLTVETAKSGANVSVRNLTFGPWTEGTGADGGTACTSAGNGATWNAPKCTDTATGWNGSGANFGTAAPYGAQLSTIDPAVDETTYTAGVLAAAQSWLSGGSNYGLALIAAGPNNGEPKFHSRQTSKGAAKRPQLRLKYRVPTPGGCSGTESLNASADTWIDAKTGNDQNKNYGDSDRLQTTAKASEQNNALVKFDLTGIVPAGAVINSATLKVMVQAERDNHVDTLHRVVTAWTEGTGADNSGATWNYPVAGTSTTWLAGDFSGSDYAGTSLGNISTATKDVYQSVSVTSTVQDWVNGAYANNGFVILGGGSDAGDAKYYSREEPNTARVPVLEVSWTLAPAAVRTNSLTAKGTLVTGGKTVTLTQTLTAGETIDNVVAGGTVTVTGTNGASASCGSATLVSADNDLSATGDAVVFSRTCTVTAGSAPGSVTFSAGATADAGKNFTAAFSNSVLVTPPLIYKVTIDSPLTATPITNVGSISEYSLEVSEPGICYAVADNDAGTDVDVFYTINQTTGAFVAVGNLGTTNVEAITDSVDGTLTYGANGGTWGTINRTTGVFTAIGAFGTAGGSAGEIALNDVDGLAVAADGTYYGTHRRVNANDLLFQINPATGAHVPGAFESPPDSGTFVDYLVIPSTAATSTGADDIDDIAVDPATGVMYGIANSGTPDRDWLVTIDRDTAAVTVIAALTSPASGEASNFLYDMEGLSFRGTQLVGTTGDWTGPTGNNPADSFFAIDKATGVATIEGAAGGPDSDFESLSCPTTTSDTPGGNTIPPTDSNEVVTNTPSGSIGDLHFYDNNGNGIYEPGLGETGVPGATVLLVTDLNNNGVADPGEPSVYQSTSDGTQDVDGDGNIDPIGYYNFRNLAPGDYVVETSAQSVVAPPSSPNAGQYNLMVATNPGGEQIARTVTCTTTCSVITDADFGFIEGAILRGTVFHDVDSNGSLGSGEPGLSPVTVTIDPLGSQDLGAGPGNPVTIETDAAGEYSKFVPPGDYTITYDYADVTAIDSTLTTKTTPISITLTTNAGQEYSGLDFGVDNSGKIGDTIYNDADGNGSQNGEPGLAGVTVWLYNAAGTTLIDTKATDANGNYLFGGLPDATYTVRVDTATIPIPSPFTNTGDPNGLGDSQAQATVTNGGSVLNMDFGYKSQVQQYTLSGRVYDSSDNLGLTPVTVTASIQGDGTFTTTTNGTGAYSFPGIPAGSIVTVTVDEGTLPSAAFQQTTDPDGTLDGKTVVTVNNNVTGVNFGYDQDYGSIAGSVCFGGGDGACAPGETGIAGVTITLLKQNTSGVFVSVGTDTTDVNGDYDFPNLAPGVYQVVQTSPANLLGSLADADGGNPDNISVTLALGQDVTGRDFEETLGTVTIGNRVWLDENGNGVQDAGEAGIANLTVTLTGTDLNGNAVSLTTTTDADGGYLFTAPLSNAAGYTVTVTPSAGLNATYNEDTGTTTPDNATLVSTTGLAGQAHLTADFGYNWAPSTDVENGTGTGAIGDRIWNDANGNGVQDPGEAGIAGVTVKLLADTNGDGVYGGAGDTILTKVTDAAGNYIFDGVAAGAYVVEVDTTALLAGGYNTAPSGDPDGDGDNATNPIVLAPGDVFVNADFGYKLDTDSNPSTGTDPAGGSTIGDLVYFDANGNGSFDVGDYGVPGVSVTLLDNTGKAIATTITDASGNYSFPGLPAGTYTVVVNDTANVLGGLPQSADPDATKDSKHTLAVDGTSAYNAVDFGYTAADATPGVPGTGVIGDTVFLDTGNGAGGAPDGLFQAGEGLQGVTVKLYDGATLVATATTDANGHYSFGGLADAIYTVKVDTASLPGTAGQLTNTVDPDTGSPGDSESSVVISGGNVNLTQDFGYKDETTPNTIAGTVWNDTNADGTLDTGETLEYAGVTVVLKDGDGNIVATTVTDANGDYSFPGLPDGSYTVDVTDAANLLNGLWHTLGTVGTNNESQSDPYTVAVSGGNTYPADFGYYGDPAALGNRVWADDGDGIQEVGEPGLANVKVTLTIDWPNGPDSTVVTTTDANGYYSFGNLLLDEDYNASTTGDPATTGLPKFTITVATPAGGTVTLIGQGGPALDSNDPAGTVATVDQGQTNDTYDFGYTGLGFVNGRVYEDSTTGGTLGVYDPGIDTPQAGVTVTITDSANVVHIVTTDANGLFSQPVPAGATKVDVDQTTLTGIVNPTLTTNASGEGSDPTVVTVPSGGSATDNTGYVTNGTSQTVTGKVYEDKDNSGTFTSGDVAQGGASVVITDSNGGVYTVTTNGTGDFSQAVPAGATVVNVDETTLLITNPTLTTNASGEGSDPTTVTVPANGTANDNTGYAANAASQYVTGRVYTDINGNGQYDAGTDTPQVGATVVITDAKGGVYNVLTGPTGTFLQAVAAGNAVVDVDEGTLTGLTNPTLTTDALGEGTDPTTVNVPAGSFGFDNTGYVSEANVTKVTGHLYIDTNGDGNQDPGEPNLPNVDVVITPTGGLPFTVTTDANGDWTATVPPGSTTANVDETDPDFPAGYVQTEGTDPSTVTAVLGTSVPTDNDGYAPPVTIGNRVWLDENGNGVQDAGEAGIANLTVTLTGTDLNGNAVSLTTTTDADGGYLFTAPLSNAAGYTVTVTPSLGLNATYNEDTGTTTPDNATVVLTAGLAGQAHLTADFGYNWAPTTDVENGTGTGAIGDRIWNDANGDGVQDPGEAGIAGVTVKLLTDDNGDGVYGGAGDNPATTTTTNAAGNYIFDGVAAGAYVVEVDTTALLAGGYNTAPSGDPDGDGDNATNPIVLAPGDVFVNADFGYKLDTDSDPNTGTDPAGGSTIGDLVYFDANGNGSFDVGDYGVPGVSVTLLDNTGKAIATTITDANGNYSFPGLPAGTYTVVVNDTENVLGGLPQSADPDATKDSKHTLPVDGTSTYNNVDFGYTAPDSTPGVPGTGVIGDTVFLDTGNGAGGAPDGLFQAGEGLQGVTVKLYDGATLVATATTDANGHYSFGGLADAIYTVKVDTASLPGTAGQLTNTVDPDTGSPGDSESSVVISGGNVDLTQDFGYQDLTAPNTIEGTLWNDTNADGTLDVGETVEYAGVTVVLKDGDGNIVATTVTDANGDYSFPGLPDGTFTVDVTDAANVLNGLWHTLGTADTNNESQSDPYTVAVSGGGTYPADFGYYGAPAVLGNRVWADNGDGIQQGGEPGLAGVEVTLTIDWPNGPDSTVVTSTDANGYYSFGNLLLDEDYNASTIGNPATTGLPKFTITVATPAGGTPTLIAVGSDPAVDSNNPAGTVTTVDQGQTNDTYDFGYTGLGYVNGRVYEDSTTGGTLGVYDPGIDTPQAGVTVTITDSASVVHIVTTDANGLFSQPVPAGATKVDVDQTTLTGIVNPTLTTNASGEGSDPTVVTVPSGGSATDNTGYVTNATSQTVTGKVYEDKDNSGTFTSGDVAQGGASVVITDSNGGVYTVTTNGTGDFSQAVPAGATTVDVDETTLSITNPTLTTNASGEGSDPTTVTVPAGGTANDNTGYVANATAQTVTGKVYEDVNGNGVYDSGTDTPQVGAKVVITASNGGVTTVTTDANGDFSQAVPPGATTVNVDETTLSITSPTLTTNASNQGSDPTVVNVPASGTGVDNTGYVGPTSVTKVTGHLYIDTNGDGNQDPGEPNLPNVNVVITPVTGSPFTVTTDANGNWTATVPPGATTANVDETDPDFPAGYVQTEGTDPTTVTAVLGATTPTDNDGFAPTWEIGDRVWYDTDKDGIQDPDEPGIFNVAVSLSGTDNKNQPVTRNTVTDGSGAYAFPDLLPGTYTVTFTAPGGYTITQKDAVGSLSTLADSFDSDADPTSGAAPAVTLTGDNQTIDAGMYIPDGQGTVDPARISDRVWYDTDGDGIQDEAEPKGIAGVFVELWTGGVGSTKIGDTYTDGRGYYEFAGLPAGSYEVEFVLPSGYTRSPKYATGATTPTGKGDDSDANQTTGRTDLITLAAGANLTSVDAGMRILGQNPAAISDFVWYDTDNDGVQDTGEPGIPGVVVNLYDATGAFIATVQTNANGNYAFTGLDDGTYQVEFELPTGYDSFSPQGQGGDVIKDSDVDPGTGIALVNLLAGEVNTATDAGMYISGKDPIQLGDYVWIDGNANQSPDYNEWLDGVDVVLYDALGIELTRVTTANTAVQANYLFAGVGQGSYRVAIDTSTLPPNLEQIADPDSTCPSAGCNEETELLNQVADNLKVDFGHKPAVKPDLTPVITLIPNVMVGPTNFEVWVQCIELLAKNTSGTITLRVPKDSRWTLTSWNTGLTTLPVSGKSVQNGVWTLDSTSDPNTLIFTTTTTIVGLTQSNFGFSAAWFAGQTVGTYTASVVIVPGSGGEVRTDNNTDAEKADYSF